MTAGKGGAKGASCRPLRRDRIAAELARLGGVAPCSLTVLARCGSTNDEIRRAAASGAPHGAAVIADEQTAGRGRRGHQWYSPPADNLYLSVLLRLSLDAPAAAAITLALGVAVAEVVDRHLPTPRAALKWPNDVYLDDRKVAGLLVEVCDTADEAIALSAGIGLNILGERFPSHLEPCATSLVLAGGADLVRERIAAELLDAVGRAAARYQQLGLSAFHPQLTARDWLRGRQVRCQGVAGEACGLDARGQLLLRGSDGELRPVIAGQVVVV